MVPWPQASQHNFPPWACAFPENAVVPAPPACLLVLWEVGQKGLGLLFKYVHVYMCVYMHTCVYMDVKLLESSSPS